VRIGILSRNPTLYSTRRLQEAAEARGHNVAIFDTLRLALRFTRYQRAGVRPPRHLNPAIEGVIPRIGASVTQYGVNLVRQLESSGVVSTATADGIARSRYKTDSMRIMREADLPVPRTAILDTMTGLTHAVRAVGGYPVVIKLNRGTQGAGVMLAHSDTEAKEMLAMLYQRQDTLLIQEFVAEANGDDLRVLVVGNRCVAAMRRSAADGEFRANLHLGGSASAVDIPPRVADLAVRAARVHGLGVAGVDLIPSSRGLLLLEVNSSPGLEGIEAATEVDVAEAIVLFLEQQIRDKSRRRRRRKKRRR
jgi:ribosomal protein S6--L-glutamate ligase